MTRRFRAWGTAGALLLLSGLLTGCAGMQDMRRVSETCPPQEVAENAVLPETPCVVNSRGAKDARELGLLMEEVATLARQGEQALRDAASSSDSRPLRKALLLLALNNRADDVRALELLEAHLAQGVSEDGEGLLASLLREQIRARQTLRSSLTSARSERDEFQRQLDELRAIEEQIRDRARTTDMELQK
jgi:hypothetical protein